MIELTELLETESVDVDDPDFPMGVCCIVLTSS